MAAAPQPLIIQAIDESQRTVLKGNTHPLARPEFDLGTAPASLPMQRMLLVLKRSDAQEAALRKVLDDQQDRNSPNYHKWMTPEQFGAQFGPTDSDMQMIITWLQSHGFQVGTTRGRTVLEFSGSASQVQEAFHTTIHKYLVNGEQHWANATDPSIPSALVPAVAGIASLNNFPRKAMNVPAGVGVRDSTTGKIHSQQPMITFPSGCVESNSSSSYCQNWLGPADFATIYDVQPLWNAGIDGTGVTIAIVGETDIQMSDVQAFRSFFGLPSNNPVFIWNGPDPGIQGDESEADIDVQWSGAVAKGATIDFVISQSTETTSGVDLSAVYIVDQNLAPIMSESYGECELGLGTTGNQFYNVVWQQASAQGITVFISAGDAGSAGCDNFDAGSPSPAQYGLQVSGYASTPYNVAVGGTDFNDFNDPGTYWSPTNAATTQESALSYIPESTWNDTCTNALWEQFPQLSPNPEVNCNNPNLNDVITVGGSGGVSACTTPSGATPSNCAGGYAKPSWQSGTGVPQDGKRDIPDVSLFASNGFVGHAYVVCEADAQGDCPSGFLGFGGTSVSSPAFAGIMALVNQKTGDRQGNANYILYKLATQQPSAFHDVTVGTNAMPCATGSPNCTTTISGDAYGILNGYNTTTGYDLATGLGSVDANNLVTKWTSVTLLPSLTTLSNVNPTTITHGQAVSFTATVAPQSGTGAAPTGVVSLEGGMTSGTIGIAGFNLANGSVTGTTEMLPGGTYSLTAHYPGDSIYGASDSSAVSVTVAKENSQPQAFLVTLSSNGSVINGNTNTAVYGSPYILRVNVDDAAGQLCAPAATTGATACPTGTVTMTDNGSALDGGAFTLNSFGYFEDQTVQLPGGTDSVKAAYAGDNSFNASSVTTPFTITPAPTSVSLGNLGTISVGSLLDVVATVASQSSGAAPGGTVTFSVNGSAVSGSVSYSGTPGSPSSPASLTANFASSASPFSSPGSFSVSSSYSGDGNYAASSSSATTITVLYPAPVISLTPTVVNVNPGASVNMSALVDTTNKTVYPTGTVNFVNWTTGGLLAGPIACASTKDSGGNYACQGAASFTPTGAVLVSAQYSGDTNYPSSISGYAQIVVNDFSISAAPSATVTQGSSTQVPINITALGAFNSTVGNFTCSGLPAETTCAFNPTTVTGGSGSTTLTISTTPLGQSRQIRRAANEGPGIRWTATAMLPLLGLCVIGVPAWKRRRSVLPVLTLVAIFVLLPSCGGGGTPPPPNNPMPSISSLSPTQQAAGSQSQTLMINGSGFISSSTVTYNNTAHAATYMSGSQLSINLSSGDMSATGTFPVVVMNPAPGGGSSSPANFNVVSGTPGGTFNVTVSASGPLTTHTATIALTVQ